MSEWKEIRRPFREALISGFNWSSLSLVLRYHCERRLDRITAQSAGFDTNVDEVIEDAVRNGWLEKLAQGALEENKQHSGLKATVPLIMAGVEAEGTAYYQGDVFNVDDPQRSDSREPGTSSTTIIQGDVFTIGDISGSEGIAIGRSSSASVEKSTHGEKQTAEANGGGPEPDAQELHQRLVDEFNIEELQDLCFALGVDYEELGGTGKSAKARELVLYMQRRGRLGELNEAIRAKRGSGDQT
ncbi:MAG: effector-associated domain EAD1-containing protein [Candidatus Promineifilaceae bacterium]|jgi:hypothetical protein